MGKPKMFLWYNHLHKADTFLEKHKVAQLVKKFNACYETGRFILLHSQQPTPGPYSEPFESSPHCFV
jgi:hypothetical protein